MSTTQRDVIERAGHKEVDHSDMSDEEAMMIARAEIKTDPKSKLSNNEVTVKARRMSDVQPESISWWWQNRIPRGNLTLFAGNGGCGKSSATMDLIGRVTTGRTFPHELNFREPENVVIINNEDDAATIQRPRLDAAGADCSRVHLLDALEIGGQELWIDFSNFIKPIEDYIVACSATLLVVDPISGHMGGKKQNDTSEVREVLQKLQSMAKRTGCTIIAITHSPKTATSALSSIIGSQAFVSCARAAFAFVVDKEDPKRRIMLNAKSNYSADETGLAYRIVDAGGVGRVEWEADPITDHPDSFFTPAIPGKSSASTVENVAAMLAEFIGEDQKPKREIDSWAKANEISVATLRRAKDKNGHEAVKVGDSWYWTPMPRAENWGG